MKKIFAFVFIFAFYSCNQKITKEDISKINGYWEIENVTFPDGTNKKYTINETYDFFEIKGESGFRKKVNPQLDGRFLVNNQSEKVTFLIEKGKSFLVFSTNFAKWKEEIKTLNEDKLVLINSENIEYNYKKAGPINLESYGKKAQ
jgi:hypothetical protein